MMSNEEVFRFILSHYKVIKMVGGEAHCICPIHGDNKPSLHIAMGGKKILLDCKAGCDYKDVLAAVGLKPEQLYYDYHNKDRSETNKQYVSKTQYCYRKNCEGEYPYRRIDTGQVTHYKYRLPGKNFKQGYDKDGTWINSLKDIDTSLSIFCNGDISRLKQVAEQGGTIYYFEGEKDCINGGKHESLGFTCGSSGDWEHRKKVFNYLKSAQLIIFADDDENNSGINSANKLKQYFDSLGDGKATVVVPAKGMNIKGGDFSDYMSSHTREELLKLIEDAYAEANKETVTEKAVVGYPVPDVMQMLAYKVDYDRDGNEKSRKVLQTVRNFEIIMENDSRVAGKIMFDEFAQQACLTGDVPWETGSNYRAWSSHDDSALFSVLQSDYGMNSRNDYFDALKNVSMRNRFHPVRNLLDSLKWNGKENIRQLLVDYLGAEDTEYTCQVMRLWMLGGVARVYHPGCKFDYTLILQGRQGIGKSTFLQLLAMDDTWFNDSLDSLDSDKAAQSLMGSWIIELAELKSLARTTGGVDSIKRFLTATQDKYRMPYERRADVFLRQCIFSGTTNKSDFLQDETGNRRFLIIQTGVNEPKKSLFSTDAIRDIKEAWAQAVHIWKTEKPRLILPESCQEEAQRLQEDSMADDGKIGIITDYLEGKQRTCALEIWQEALNESGRPQKWQASEIINIVLAIPGWERVKSPTRYGKYGQQKLLQKRATNVYTNSQKSGYQVDEFVQVDAESQMEIPFD